MFNLRGLNKGGRKKTKKPKGRKPKGRKPKGTKQRKKSNNRKKSSTRKKAGEIINKYALVKILKGNSYELGIVLEKDISIESGDNRDQYHNILFENGEEGDVQINKVKLIKNQDKNIKISKKNKEIAEYIKAFSIVFNNNGDPRVPGTGSQSGKMIKKGVRNYNAKIRFDVFAAAANGRPFREEIMNVISCCKEYQTEGKCVHKDKPKLICIRRVPQQRNSSEDSSSEYSSSEYSSSEYSDSN